MTEHLTEQEVNLFRSRTIGPGERKRVDSHVGNCDSCLRLILPSEDLAIAYSETTEALLSDGSEAPFHLSSRDLERYADDTADQADRIIAESHLEICDQCTEVWQSLVSNSAGAPASLLHSTSQSEIAAEGYSPGWRPAGLVTPTRAIAFALLTICFLLILLVWQRRQVHTVDQNDRETAIKSPSLPQPSSSPSSSETVVVTPENPISDQSRLKDNGREIGLDQTGKLIGLEEYPEASRSIVQAALIARSLAKPQELNKLTSPPITLMGESSGVDSFGLIGPSGTVTMSNNPTLRWMPFKGATSYTVSVFDTDFNRVAQSASQTATQWTTPKLRRGMIYSWEVVAIRNGQEVRSPVAPAPRAQFKVLEADKLGAVSQLKLQQPVSHLALGLTFARFGLVNDAEGEFRKLVKENPDSELAKKLLRTVQAWRER